MAPPTLTLCELDDPGIPGLESYSPFCLKIHRALRASGLAYGRNHSSNPGAFKRYNPAGQVPVLLVGDVPVPDSTDILHRLDTIAPNPLGMGTDLRTRAEAWLWEDFADTSLNAYLIAARWVDDRNWPTVRDTFLAGVPSLARGLVGNQIRKGISGAVRNVTRGGMASCWRHFAQVLDSLEARTPEAGWWVGDSLSVADVSLFGQLHQIRQGLTPWQAGEVTSRPRLNAYLDRVDAATRETWQPAASVPTATA